MSKLQAAARKTDPTEHGGEIITGSGDVLINDLGAARVTDQHTCPAETDAGVPHVGGPIEKGSETVLINDLKASRVEDVLVCLKPPVPEEEEGLAGCDVSAPPRAGFEKKRVGDLRTDKSFLYGTDVKGTCRVARVVDESAEGALGKARGTVEVGRVEGKLQAGYSHDRSTGKGFAGLDLGGGGALLDGRAKGETPLLPIPFTDWGFGVQVEVFGALGALEAKGKAKLDWKKLGIKAEGALKVGAGVGLGLKVGIVLAPLKSVAGGDLPQDVIAKGSPDVFIGG